MRVEVYAVVKFVWMLNMESVNFHRHCDCMGQMHCPSNRCRNGAATVNKCRGQEQKWHSLNVKRFRHLHQQNALAGRIFVREEASAVVQHVIQQCVWGIVLEYLGYHKVYSR